MKLTRVLILTAGVSAAAITTAPAAHATPGHTSCKDLGALNVSEAQAKTLAPEIRSLPPGSIAGLIAVVQVGGDFYGEAIPAFCLPK